MIFMNYIEMSKLFCDDSLTLKRRTQFMSHILITFLGKVIKDGGRYEEVTYRFDNGQTYTKSFFGLALLEHLQASDSKPDKLVILGTTGSMWDAFFEVDEELMEKHEDEYYALNELIEDYGDKPPTEEQSEELNPYLSLLENELTQYLNIPCEFHLIPYGRKQEEQTEILKIMADCVTDEDKVTLDITHGLRHLPMLVVLSAMYLKVVKAVEVAGIYYGAKDMQHLETEDVAPALDLSGLLQIAEWVKALNSFEKDRDYGVFSELLETDGLTKQQTKPLKDAAFFERIFNVSQAAKKLTAFSQNTPEELPGMGSLFSDTLSKHIEWPTKGNLYDHQRELAYSFLDKKDYQRAAIFAVEAFITKLMHDDNYTSEDIREYNQRDAAKNLFLDEKLGDSRKISDFRLLKNMRNAMAHVNEPRDDVKRIMEDEVRDNNNSLVRRLEIELRRLMNRLFPQKK